MLYRSEETKLHGEHATGRWADQALHVSFEDHDWPMFSIDFPDVVMSSVDGVELDIENTGEYPITLFGYAEEESPYCWSSGLLALEPGERETMRIFCFFDKAKEVREAYPRMLGAPGHAVAMTSEYYENPKPAVIRHLRLELEGEGHPAQVVIHSAQKYGMRNPLLGEAAKDLYPIADKFGQYRHSEWPGKIHRTTDFARQREKEEQAIAASPAVPDRNKFGGWTGGPKFEATGHFYTKKVDGRWWFVDPEGCLYWAYGPACVRPQSKAIVEGFEYLFEEMVPENDYYQANLKRKYGANWKELYFDRVHERINHWGMNTMGNFSDVELCRMGRTPYTVGMHTLKYAARYGLGKLDGEWLKQLEETVVKNCENTANDPYCLGYFIDNEIHDDPDPGRWDYYFAACRDTLKKHAPASLYLGSRQDWHRYPRGGTPIRVDPDAGVDVHDYSSTYVGYETVLRAYAKYADVLTFNQYRYTYYNLRMPDYADKPILIGETTVGALDRGQLHPSLRPTQCQEERAFACKHILESALDNPWIAGVHWFMYVDQICTGSSFNGENFQMGMIDICDTPYAELIESIKEIGYSIYDRRGGKA